MMKTVLSIAGSDSSGGAGIQADIKTMLANGVYAMTAITALTAQNTLGVAAIMDVTTHFLKTQLNSIFQDIYPDAVKIGMVSSGELIRTMSESLKSYEAKNIVVDPVMVATSGAKLICTDAIETLCQQLLPLAKVITPNMHEAALLAGRTIETKEDMLQAAQMISKKYHCAVLVKGGHHVNNADDLLYENDAYRWFKGERIANPNTHGTGCTLSSAIASYLAKGDSLETAIEKAKNYVSGAIGAMLDLGKGSGPLHHGYAIPQG